jgi:hypothetical protein
MHALVATGLGVVLVDLDGEEVIGEAPDELPVDPDAGVSLPRLVAAARQGSTVVAVVDRKPPLLVSYDAGTTWRESGAGLPAGRCVAISPDHPDHVLYATSSRLYLSEDGGRFWRSLAPELEDVRAIAWAD